MAKKVKSYRLEDATIAGIAAYAKSRGSTETQVMETAAQGFLASAQSGVPDLVAPEVAPGKPSALAEARAQHVRDIAGRQRRLNEAKARASR